MSADATDPVKALREFVALRDTEREYIAECIRAPSGFESDEPNFALARAALSAAPALLARIEAGEGLLRESRPFVFRSRMTGAENGGPLYQKIAAFLAGKEANRG